MAVSEAESGEATLVTAPRHPADNTISNICSAEIQMGCHFQVGVLLTPVMILKHFTCNLQAASSTQSPLPTFYLHENILLVWSRLLPTAGPECALGAGRGDLFNYKVSQLHSYNTQHISHRITQRSAPALSLRPPS